MPAPSTTLKIGTADTPLARLQAQEVVNLLTPHCPGHRKPEIIAYPISTPPRLEPLTQALLNQEVNATIHAATDLPLHLPPGIMIAATPARGLPNDLWLGPIRLADLPPGAGVRTNSPRLQAQLLLFRPDLRILLPHENAYADAGTFGSAADGYRVGQVPAELLPTDQFIPAPGQGTLAILCRQEDSTIQAIFTNIHDSVTAASLAFERKVARTLGLTAEAAFGVCAEPRHLEQPGWIVRAIGAIPDGTDFARATLLSNDPAPAGLAALTPILLATLESRGLPAILERLRSC